MRHSLRELTACDRYARTRWPAAATDTWTPHRSWWTRSSRPPRRFAATLTCWLRLWSSITPPPVFPATDFLDAADTLARNDGRRLPAALHALRQIDRVVINAATDLGADNGVLRASQNSDVQA